MAISLKSVFGGGGGVPVELGECVLFPDSTPGPNEYGTLITPNGATYLRAGQTIPEYSRWSYSSAFSKFEVKSRGNLISRVSFGCAGYGDQLSFAYGNGVWVSPGGTSDSVAYSNDLRNWKYATDWSDGSSRNAVAFGGGKFVMCGNDGYLATSVDGIIWTRLASHTSNVINWAAYNGSNLWVVVGAGGYIITSTDTVTWTVQSSGVTEDLNHVAHGNGLWVIVGSSGTILTSTDGVVWTARVSGVGTTGIWSVAYGAGVWAALPSYARDVITSTDGITWTVHANVLPTWKYTLDYVNGQWFTVGGNGSYATSADAVTWSADVQAVAGYPNQLISIYYANGIYVIGGWSGNIFTSTDLVTWNLLGASLGVGKLNAMASGTSYSSIVVVGDAGVVLTEDSSYKLTVRSTSITDNLTAVLCPTNWQQIVVGSDQGKIFKSANGGVTWTSSVSNFGTSAIRCFASNGSSAIVGGDSGALCSAPSYASSTWTARTSGFGTDAILAAAYGNNLWVIAGENGKLATSTDMVTWTLQTSGFGTSAIRAIAYGNGKWLIVGDDGKMAISPDGVTWALSPIYPGTPKFVAVVYRGKGWMIFSDSSYLMYSEDGVSGVLGQGEGAYMENNILGVTVSRSSDNSDSYVYILAWNWDWSPSSGNSGIVAFGSMTQVGLDTPVVADGMARFMRVK